MSPPDPLPTSAPGADAPMRFTRAELAYGAFRAWLAFMTMLLVIVGVTAIITQIAGPAAGPPQAVLPFTFIVLLYTAAFGGLVSAAIALVFAPAAGLVGRLLRGQTRIPVHLLCYAGLGALIGALIGVVGAVAAALGGMALGNDFASVLLSPVTAVAAALGAPSVCWGWWSTMCRALLPPRPSRRRPARQGPA